jgi:hypothetical protein
MCYLFKISAAFFAIEIYVAQPTALAVLSPPFFGVIVP